MQSPFNELKKERSGLILRFSEGRLANGFREKYTETVDQYFRRSIQESKVGQRLFNEKVPFALVAVGGYGRKELCVHSDIDLVVIFKDRIPRHAKELARDIFFPLWDLGLELGYGTRTIKDCLKLSKENFEVLTSLLDARFLCGDSPLYLELVEKLRSKVFKKVSTSFRRWLDDQDVKRMEKFGDASYLLEPNLKEGIGGLRDFHHILWCAKLFFQFHTPRDLEYQGKLSHKEYHELMKYVEFIWLVRNHLHIISGRKNDRLAFEYQTEIAKKLGYQDKKGLMAVEEFLGRLHSSMAGIKALHQSFLKAHLPRSMANWRNKCGSTDIKEITVYQGQLSFKSSNVIMDNPLLLIQIFELNSRSGCPLSLEAKRLINEFLFLVDEKFKNSRNAVEIFLNILNAKWGADALDVMYETGFLETFIPEFHIIKDRVQFDAYHIYPVGRHSLETFRNLKSLSKEKDFLLVDIYSDLPHPERLLLAGLFHDIGKTGKKHADKGARITRRILTRFQCQEDAVEDITFLVRNHLLLVETATRRDIDDEKVVVNCARSIGTIDRLKMLYLLTLADSKATGPRAWNAWTGNLVQDLFFKILHILTQGELATEAASRKAERVKSRVRSRLSDKIPRQELEKLFEAMSPRYLLNTKPDIMARHIIMAQSLEGSLKAENPDNFILEPKNLENEGIWELTFMAKDRPGLFADLAGVLSLYNINVLTAHIYTWRNGIAVDLFRVSPPLDPVRADEIWHKIRRDLQLTFKGKLSLTDQLKKKSSPSLFAKRIPSRPPRVQIDNQVSGFFTLIEVFADDRIGLLHLITRTLFDLKLDIRIAKIATKADQVADAFYIRDFLGQKVEDQRIIATIKQTLLDRLRGA